MSVTNFLDSLLKTPRLISALLSPDHHFVVWSWLNLGPARDVYLVPTDGSAKPRRLTNFGEDTEAVSWASDSRSVIVRHDHSGDDHGQLFQVDIFSGEVRTLTPARPNYQIRGGQLDLSGRYLIYAANHDFESGHDIEPAYIYKLDLVTGQHQALAKPLRPRAVPTMNDQGTKIFYLRADLHPAGRQIWLVNSDGSGDKEILNFGADRKVSASWFADGERILFLADGLNYRRLGIYHWPTETIKYLSDDPKRNFEEAFVPPGENRVIVALEYETANSRVSLFDTETGQEERLPDWRTRIPLAPLEADRWVSLFYSSRQPAELIIHRLEATQAEKILTPVFDYVDYQAADLAQAENYTWHSTDGEEIQGWLFRPKGEVRGTIVRVHGGPTAHSEDEFRLMVQFFVSQGFVVLDPNYRGSTGFGLAFQNSIKKDGWGGQEQADIKTGIESLIKDGIALPGKIGITGTSYGGYSAWHAITHWPTDLVAAAAPICGMTDLVADYETTEPHLRTYAAEMMGGSPAEQPDRYFERSPVNFVQNIKGKLLIVQGERDPNVTIENLHSVERALKEHQISYELLLFPDEGHFISKTGNLKTLLERLAKFFADAFES